MILYNDSNQSWIVRVDLPTRIRTITLAGWVCVLIMMLHFQLRSLKCCDCSRLLTTTSIFGQDCKQATKETLVLGSQLPCLNNCQCNCLLATTSIHHFVCIQITKVIMRSDTQIKLAMVAMIF